MDCRGSSFLVISTVLAVVCVVGGGRGGHHQRSYDQSQQYIETPYSPYSVRNTHRMQRSHQPYHQASSYATKATYAAVCDFSTGAGSGNYGKLQGKIKLTQEAGYYHEPVKFYGTISGLQPGKHGVHVHMYGDFSNGCTSAGAHYNPLMVSHGSPYDDKYHRHVGDLGNIEANAQGVAYLNVANPLVSLAEGGRHPIGGRAIVVHEKIDDLGRGYNEESKKTGNSGARVGCCVIVYTDPANKY